MKEDRSFVLKLFSVSFQLVVELGIGVQLKLDVATALDLHVVQRY